MPRSSNGLMLDEIEELDIYTIEKSVLFITDPFREISIPSASRGNGWKLDVMSSCSRWQSIKAMLRKDLIANRAH